MRTLFYSLFILILAIASCKQDVNQANDKVLFEIFETYAQNEVPGKLIVEFQQMGLQTNTDFQSPIIAFVHVDSTLQLSGITKDTIKFMRTVRAIDRDKGYDGIIAVRSQAALNNSDLKKTKPRENDIEIYFNQKGASKWSNLTKNNVGKMLAFSVDNKIYNLTSVNGEIKNGIAIIRGLENNEHAIKVSGIINSGL